MTLPESLREQFPALGRTLRDSPVVYLDSAATYLKPLSVIDAVSDCYRTMAGTIGRGVHLLAEEASAAYDDARETIAAFINADADEIIFVRNATEAINLAAAGLAGDSVIAGSLGEHHSNLLPWRNGNRFEEIQLLDDGRINQEHFGETLNRLRPKLATFSTISNALGTRQDAEQLIGLAHQHSVDVLLDANQSIAHEPLDVRTLDCEYLCFSGHKLGGPTGIGVLYAKRDRLEKIPPMLLGGGMVETVGRDEIDLADLPMRLEAGTPAFEAALGLAAACDFLDELGLDEIGQHESELTRTLVEKLAEIPRIAIVGPESLDLRGSIVAFHVEGLEAHGAARMLSNRANICVRSGFHCAELAHKTLGLKPTVRVSFGMYNTLDEVETLVETLKSVVVNLH